MPRLAHEIYKKRCYAAPNSDHQKGQGFENSSWQNQSLLTVEIKDEAACLILWKGGQSIEKSANYQMFFHILEIWEAETPNTTRCEKEYPPWN